MTREEKRTRLIRHLKYNRSIGADYLITDEDADEIIESLEQEPCEGCISRKAAIDAIRDCVNMDIYTIEVKECLEALPPVTPVKKAGKWIINPYGIDARLICDNCLASAPYNCRTNYCPNCGRKMEGVEG